jgi:hypothetical protein
MDATCPACHHPRHRAACIVRLLAWRRFLRRLTFCSCTYWDAQWTAEDNVLGHT